jgi:hypothetical protein
MKIECKDDKVYVDGVEYVAKEEPKKEKWNPKGGKYYIHYSGETRFDNSLMSVREFGLEYQTKELAEWARDKMRKHNRILAWLSEQEKQDDNGYVVYYSSVADKWMSAYKDYNIIGQITMSQTSATKLADMLNNGLIEL